MIPYTSIIEQTAQIFREILGDENVLEFHSGVQFDQQEDDASSPETAPLTRSVETWDVPVIVTTAVQFFESLYACRPSKCRKLHNLAQMCIRDRVLTSISPSASASTPSALHTATRSLSQAEMISAICGVIPSM